MIVDKIPVTAIEKGTGGSIKIDLEKLPLPSDFVYRCRDLIYLPPRKSGGNHRHARREIFISLSDDVEMHWIDKTGLKHIEKFKEQDGIFIFDVHPFVPHAVLNKSKDAPAILVEFADGPHNNQ